MSRHGRGGAILGAFGGTRRDFLHQFGLIGGSALLMGAMDSMELLAAAPAGRKPAWSGRPANARVVVLGAGVSGLAVAYELRKLGYEVQVLEARDRVGGVNHTVRRGTEETDLDGVHQRCDFDEGLYVNAGPWRIPHTHQAVIDYCRELGVALEVFVNENDASYLYFEGENFGQFSGKPVRLREIKADMRGFTSELLAKAIDQRALDVGMSPEDVERLVSYLVNEGYLDSADRVYRGGDARGGGEPYDVTQLLRSGFANRVRSVDASMTRPPVFQPVGGMDQFTAGFARAMPGVITLQAEVHQIRQTEDGVHIVWEDRRSGTRSEIQADYVVSCLPLTILRNLDVNLSSEMMEVVRNTNYSNASKIGLQMRRRFWEEDEGIYGGMTYSNLPIGQFAFPSNDYLTRKGVVLGYYGGSTVGGLREKTNPERIEHVLAQAGKVHPQLREEFENAYAVLWENVRYSEGAYASGGGGGGGGGAGAARLEQLRTPDGRIYIGCAAASTSAAWMEGAVSAAWAAVDSLHQRVLGQ